MVPIAGLYESHLTVSDLSRSIAFYRDLVGLELAHTLPDGRAAFSGTVRHGPAVGMVDDERGIPLSRRLRPGEEPSHAV